MYIILYYNWVILDYRIVGNFQIAHLQLISFIYFLVGRRRGTMQKKRILLNYLIVVFVVSLCPQCVLTLPPEPPLEERVIKQPPYPDALWVEGFWQWQKWQHRYIWTPGYWKVKRHGVWVRVEESGQQSF
jgi:hypothetical protein